jgi:hypothetical protein
MRGQRHRGSDKVKELTSFIKEKQMYTSSSIAHTGDYVAVLFENFHRNRITSYMVIAT